MSIKTWWETQPSHARYRLVRELKLHDDFTKEQIDAWVYGKDWNALPAVMKSEIAGKLGYLVDINKQLQQRGI